MGVRTNDARERKGTTMSTLTVIGIMFVVGFAAGAIRDLAKKLVAKKR